MNQSNGFTLIECMLYLGISSFFTLLVLQTYMIVQKNVLLKLMTAHENISLATTIDTVLHDVASAPSELQCWSYRDPHYIQWTDDHGNTTGFAFKNNSLMKITRTRDKNGLLKNPAHSILTRNIVGSYQITIVRDQVYEITVQATALIGNKQQSITAKIHPRGAVVHA